MKPLMTKRFSFAVSSDQFWTETPVITHAVAPQTPNNSGVIAHNQIILQPNLPRSLLSSGFLICRVPPLRKPLADYASAITCSAQLDASFHSNATLISYS